MRTRFTIFSQYYFLLVSYPHMWGLATTFSTEQNSLSDLCNRGFAIPSPYFSIEIMIFYCLQRYKFCWRPVHSDQKISKLTKQFLINGRKYIPYGWVNLFLFFFLFLLKEKLQLQSLTDEYKAISKINLYFLLLTW